MGRITTHILDTAHGCPAIGVHISLFHVAQQTRMLLREDITNRDGRTTTPLLEEPELTAGIYELVFRVEDYFASKGGLLSEPPFLDVITIRFGVGNPHAHYHVPLLVSPWAYSTYRGS